MTRPRLLDLFCCEGGGAMGYHRAGFDVVGVDIVPQPNYPFEFHQADALEFVKWIHPTCSPTCKRGDGFRAISDKFDAIHASPPCQAYSTIGAPYRSGFILCGSMFGLKVRRHRNFETSFAVLRPQCEHKAQGRPYTITGYGGPSESKHSRKPAQRDFWRYLDMPWATPHGVTQAIPPAYTEWIGARLLDSIRAAE